MITYSRAYVFLPTVDQIELAAAAFVPICLKVEVDILWPDGETEVIKGFVTEYDAVKRIAEHSEAWREADRDLRTAR